jgi:hypothetical protein
MPQNILQYTLVSLLLIELFTGCNRTGVYGTVTNHVGEALPGVSVQLDNNGEFSAVTNALGEYKLNAPPGKHTIQFAKSGYTLVNQNITPNDSLTQELTKVKLWNLPSSNSVFLRENTQYKPTTWHKPNHYILANNSSAFGTTRDPELKTDNASPFIMSYKMPRYDARLTRLQIATAQVPQDASQTFPVWAPAGTIPVSLDPVVSSDTDLLHLKLLAPLEPGRYALHWGALEGYTTIDDRMYMFEIVESPGPFFQEADLELEKEIEKEKIIEGDAP